MMGGMFGGMLTGFGGMMSLMGGLMVMFMQPLFDMMGQMFRLVTGQSV